MHMLEMPVAPSADRASQEKRDQYIREAIGTVLKNSMEEVRKYHESPVVVVTMIQRELTGRASLDKQMPADPGRLEQLEDEFPKSAIWKALYAHLNVPEGDLDQLSQALNQ